MSVVDSMAAWGVMRAGEVVDVAAAVGLPLAAAAALLEQESGGGRNVFGSDGVPTGGAYVKGAEVTEQSYRAYRRALAAGTAGQQGVGPCQLTAVGFQDQADQLGGCWVPRANCTVGFRLLAGYTARWGPSLAFRAYNGGGGTVTDPNRYPSPDAHNYERQAMEKHARWADRLGAGSTNAGPPAPEVDDMTPEQAKQLDLLVQQLVTGPDGHAWGWPTFPGGSNSRFTPVDYLRHLDQRGEDTMRELAGLRALVGKQQTVAAAPIDYQQLAAVLLPQLVAALTAKGTP